VKLVTLFCNFLFQLFASVPMPLRQAIGRAAGWIFSRLPSRERAITEAQLRCVLRDTSPSRTATKVFQHIGVVAAESLNLKPFLRQSDRYIRCSNLDEIKRLLSEDRGILALTAHLGNWDLLAGYMVRQGIPLTVIGREARSKVLQEVLSQLRTNLRVETIWRSDTTGTRRIIKELTTPGHVVAALIDQDTQVKSVYVPYFDLEAKTPSSIIELAKRRGSNIVSVFMVRTATDQFEIFVEAISVESSTEEILCEYNKRLENLVRQYPEQWVWFHKRWCSRPERARFYTREYLQFLRERCSTTDSSPLARATSQPAIF
jgi:Kdo2-lipid IVA lauroyltransferase/acyltransferase